jgi:hypothetical protein
VLEATVLESRLLESRLRRAAFGDLASAHAPLTSSGAPKVRLLSAIVLGAKGRYAAAATILGELLQVADPVVASLAGSTFASHRRQLGGHTVARGFDGTALLLASRATNRLDDSDDSGDPDGLDAHGAMCDALLGLAADNLGLARVPAARRLAAAAAEMPAGWRGEVRAGWVGAEVELAAGSPEAAVAPAERAAGLARARGAGRHTIKSDLVLGAALAATGDAAGRDRAVGLIENALEAAEECELSSLIWPACMIGGNIRAELGEKYRFRAAQVLHRVLLGADPVGRRIARESPWVPI